jgi:hypothetical protein
MMTAVGCVIGGIGIKSLCCMIFLHEHPKVVSNECHAIHPKTATIDRYFDRAIAKSAKPDGIMN